MKGVAVGHWLTQFVPEIKYEALHDVTHFDPWRYSVARQPVWPTLGVAVLVPLVDVEVDVDVVVDVEIIPTSMQFPTEEMMAPDVLQQYSLEIKNCPEEQFATQVRFNTYGKESGQFSTHVLLGPKKVPVGHD